MRATTFRAWVLVVLGAIGLTATASSAQSLGTFRWRLEPFCNIVTVLVEQKGALYELTGTDDQCGAMVVGSVSGSAHLNPSGTASVSIVVVRPDGIPITTTAILNIATLNGTWADEYGAGGAFTFNPAGSSGTPRRITIRGDYAIVFPATQIGSQAGTQLHFGRTLATAPMAPLANVILLGGAPTGHCPGTAINPQAAVGHICAYETGRNNVGILAFYDGATGTLHTANPSGVSLITAATAVGNVSTFGRWAVTY
jgi:hypothetical protein